MRIRRSAVVAIAVTFTLSLLQPAIPSDGKVVNAVAAAPPLLPIQGVWFGTQRVSRIVLVVRENKLLFIHPTGAKESAFTTKANGEIHDIDIDRYDGKKQLGICRADGLNLTFTLSDPSLQDRPKDFKIGINGQLGDGTVIFTRSVTKDGLKTLQANLERDPSIDLADALAVQ